MSALAPRPWLPDHSARYVCSIASTTADATGTSLVGELDRLVEDNRQIHDRDCINLNPGTRLGMKPGDMDELASLIADGLAPEADPAGVATRVTEWRARFSGVHFTA